MKKSMYKKLHRAMLTRMRRKLRELRENNDMLFRELQDSVIRENETDMRCERMAKLPHRFLNDGDRVRVVPFLGRVFNNYDLTDEALAGHEGVVKFGKYRSYSGVDMNLDRADVILDDGRYAVLSICCLELIKGKKEEA